MKKLSQDDSRMMEKLTNIETFVKDMRGSLNSDIQKILEAMASQTDETQKEDNNSTDPFCEVDWKHYGLNCYYFSRHVRPWESAKKDCETKKAHLVVINDKQENDFLHDLSQYWTTWIGLTDADGSWKWVDGTSYAATPKFWRPGQPDNWFGHGLGGGEDCAHLKGPNGWNDGPCSQGFPYICEKKMP